VETIKHPSSTVVTRTAGTQFATGDTEEGEDCCPGRNVTRQEPPVLETISQEKQEEGGRKKGREGRKGDSEYNDSWRQ
jgi:hypothetical protein